MAKPIDLRLLLVTSGRTMWDDSDRIIGSCDLPLCDTGRAAVRQAASDYADAGLDLIICGPSEASRTTAEAFAATTGGKVKVLDELENVNLGLWEGLSADAAADRFARVWSQWREDPTSVVPPEGEALLDASDRIVSALTKALRKSKAERIGVVLPPLAMGITRCWLNHRQLSQLWQVIDGEAPVEWTDVSRDALKRPKAEAG
ncbi:MAG: histidine phosphatase family protein, partial [Planctomycetota bacterium]